MTLHENLKRRVSEAIGRRDFPLAEQLCHDAEGSVATAELAFIRGVLASARGDLVNAVALLAQAHAAAPQRSDIAYNYGVVLQQSGRTLEAAAAWQQATASDPGNTAAWVNLALATLQLGDEQAALDVYRRALNHHATNRDLLYNYANLLFRAGELQKSEAIYKKLLGVRPDDGPAWINYAKLLKTQQRLDESEAAHRQAIAHAHPADAARAHYNFANLLLSQGKWRDGFAAYEWRLRLSDAIGSPWPLPAWHESLPQGSRILLWNDQGQGDAIMYLRFASLLGARGYRLFAFVQNSLRTLAATAPGIKAAFGPTDARQRMDAQLPLCSLPHALGLETIDVCNEPYLVAPPIDPTVLGAAVPGRRRIGIAWAGNPAHANDAHRSVSLDQFALLFGAPDVDWVSLQVGDRASELAASPYRERVHDLSAQLADFAATASVMSGLDLVISIDSAPAHLAGALGRPVWTLIPAIDTDWRWGRGAATTSWYPTMRLFRQSRPGDWTTVMTAMRMALRQ
ncbi:MAG TPA: tetratricopeptide repeat protein [Pseudolabrys sp.]|nr:tetratricopeptide repeat protein [Pseudolabrys sp.]